MRHENLAATFSRANSSVNNPLIALNGARRPVEWPTVALILLTYMLWCGATAGAATLGPWIALPLIALAASFHTSLTHEVCHGHPTGNRALNDLLVAPAISLFIPHDRYRDTHLAHHHDPVLTDPYDDPESYYLDPAAWARLSRPVRAVLRLNNTLLGRMLIGPAISTLTFYRDDLARARAGDRAVSRAVRRAWIRHLANLLPVAGWLMLMGEVPLAGVLAASYAGLSLQKIRSFLEHRAHEQVRGRTVIVERGGLLGFLFLNNNLHAVHHAHPRVAWYRLPALYRTRRAGFLARNFHYRYASYGEVIRAFLLAPKDPVPHPLMPGAVANGMSQPLAEEPTAPASVSPAAG